ncbi:MAG: hypothetical protein K2O00_09370 [Muribaculaceae bacterium]|nr:hypothetical protein [Muribaculaceae bacterium]
MRTLLLLLSLLLTVPATLADESNDYNMLAKKEQMFYNAREWRGAAAMLSLMIEQRPTLPRLYARAIISSAMTDDSAAAVALLDLAMKNKVPFDSVFTNVKTESFTLGRSDLYENFLIDVKDTHPWLLRTIDNYLLDYYCFRRDGAKMVEFSKIMLEGLPDNTDFLSILAEGYLLKGETEKAMLTFRQVLYFNPSDYNATLYLANYYFNRWVQTLNADDQRNAHRFLTHANELKPTPFVTARLNQLTAPSSH